MAPKRKYTLEGKEYVTRAEYDKALDALLERMKQEREEWAKKSADAPAEAAATPPPQAPTQTPNTPQVREKPFLL